MFLSMARVVEIEEIASGIFSLLLEENRLAGESLPGQFLHIRINNSTVPFLRRPFSVAGVRPREGLVQILFRCCGTGTEILSRVRKGDLLDCLGPLGSGFSSRPELQPAVLLAGGIGVAPLLFLAATLAEKNKKVILLYGAARDAELLPLKKILPAGVEVHVATDDGSAGFKGPVTGLLQKHLQDGLVPGEIFACGPRAMMQILAEKYKSLYPLQFSLEEMMACGVGACQGCSVQLRNGEEVAYKRVCREGPVFNAVEVVW